MAIYVDKVRFRISTPLLESIESVTAWSPAGGFPDLLNENFKVLDGDSAAYMNYSPPKTTTKPFRTLNVAVDVTQPSTDRVITYVNYWGDINTYVANFSGYHCFKGWGITNFGDAIDSYALQMGI